MNRKPKIPFSIHALLVFTAFVAVLVSAGMFFFHRAARPFKDLDRFANAYDLRGWSVEIEPDLPGPYRTAGDDWSGAMPFQFNSGKPAKGWVESGGVKRMFHHPGRIGVSYLVVFLENLDDAPTFLILSKPDDNSASGGA
ncbi:hypothetical protein SH528x_001865 [Novipirellula sp. SH528]|uniref:hypothetical protein n=1 Tax=Novipirellula sp. SH528 TaxID=3454466 RepID=UPI003F9F7795